MENSKMFNYSMDLRVDIGYAIRNNEELVVDEKDEKAIIWLIKQAKKVDELEKRLNELAQTSYCIVCGNDATEVRQGRFYCHECCN